VQVTYLLHLRVVLVLTMVQSRPHHLKHQWSQISTWVSLNHICHHTYFKSSYVHIQVSHILHHHTMKLLLAFKSFQPRRPIVEIGSENWFAAGCQFISENWFAAGCKFGSENWFAAETQFQQRMLIRCSRHSFGSESQIRCRTSHSAANANSLRTTQFRQRITIFAAEHTIWQRMLIHCRRHSFGSESQFRCRQLSFGSEY